MAQFNWNDYEEAKTGAAFNWDDHPVEPPIDPRTSPVTPPSPEEGPSQLEAGLRAAAQGSSLGFSDEIAGTAGVLGYKAGQMGAVPIQSTHPEIQQKIDEISAQNDPSLGALYSQGRDQERALNKAAKEAYPKTYLGSEIASSIANPIVQAGTGLKGAMGVGGLMGLGGSRADLTKGDLGGASKDIALSSAGGALGFGVGSALGSLPGVAKVGARKASGVAQYLSNKLASMRTGISEKEIETYANQTDAVNKIIKETGGEMSVGADLLRDKLQRGLRATKDKLNSIISEALESAPKDDTLSIQPILDKLQAEKTKLNPNYDNEAIRQIDEMIGKVTSQGGEDGLTNLQGMQDTKNFLMDQAKAAYYKGGQIFNPAKESQRAAKRANAEALNILNPLSPEIEQANRQLQKLHIVEENLNKNLIAPGKPEGALLAAGSAGVGRNAATLKQLGNLTGQDVLGEAQRLAAARSFANPALLPVHSTGKSLTSALASIGIGHVLGGPVGSVVGGVVASPITLKASINVQNLIGKMISSGNTKVFGKFAPAIEKAAALGPQSLAVAGSILSQNPEFKSLVNNLEK